jgi:hypothetical protein
MVRAYRLRRLDVLLDSDSDSRLTCVTEFLKFYPLTLSIWNRIPAVIVSIGVSFALFFTGILRAIQALADFGGLTVIFISSLFVVAACLGAFGITSWSGQFIIERGGKTNSPAAILVIAALFRASTSFSGSVVALLCMIVWPL